MALERPVGEVAGDVGLVVDIGLALAEKGEELATKPESRLRDRVRQLQERDRGRL